MLTICFLSGLSDTVLKGRRWPPIVFGAVRLTFLNLRTEAYRSHPVLQRHNICVPCHLGDSPLVEVDLLHCYRIRIRIRRADNGVCLYLTDAHYVDLSRTFAD
jgi:hypothetical protein